MFFTKAALGHRKIAQWIPMQERGGSANLRCCTVTALDI